MQIPVRPDGSTPHSFAEQAEQTWANVAAQLEAAGLGMANIVHHTTYLSDRKHEAENRAAQLAALGDHEPALTVIIAGAFDEARLLEIEAMAVGRASPRARRSLNRYLRQALRSAECRLSRARARNHHAGCRSDG
ncbi:MAG: RidA family protein [Pseudomonadota bacterium]